MGDIVGDSMPKDIMITPVQVVCERDCADRAYDCHGRCEKYARYRAKCDEVLHRNEMRNDVNDAIRKSMKRKGIQAKSVFNDV